MIVDQNIGDIIEKQIKVVKCCNNHYYDSKRFKDCPYCGVIPASANNSEAASMSTGNYKQEIRGKQLAFLIVAILLSLPLLFFIYGLRQGEFIESLTFLLVYGWCPTLFWWLFFRKGKVRTPDNPDGTVVLTMSQETPSPPPSITELKKESIVKSINKHIMRENVESTMNFSSSKGAPSSDMIKDLISIYLLAKTQDERNNILSSLLNNLCHIPLTFLVLYEPVQKPIEEVRNIPLYDVMKQPEEATPVTMVRRFIRPIIAENGLSFVHAFTDDLAYMQSEFPNMINKLFMEAYPCFPLYYLHLLKDLQYDGVVINPDTQNCYLPKDLFEMFMAKGVEGEVAKDDKNEETVSNEKIVSNVTLAKFVLCNETNNRVQMKIWAEIKNGCLNIEGQAFGTAVEECFYADEYEYFYSFDEKNTKRLITLLLNRHYGNEAPHESTKLFKKLLFEKYSDINGMERLRGFCEETGIEYKFFNWF